MLRKIIGLMNLKKERDNYMEIARRYQLLLKRVAEKCEQKAGINWYGNPSIGFRQIKALAESDITEQYIFDFLQDEED
jgi:hypothetical protein